MSDAKALTAKAAELGKLAVRMTTAAGSGHPSSALSLAHLVTHLMYEKMRYDPADPWSLAADRLVLSEGHAVPMVYAAYADLGGAIGRDPARARPLTPDDVDTLRENASELDGHPNPAEGFPFFDAATGSLGMGLSVAAGLALAARLDNGPRQVYCLIGDGEAREGQIWEAFDFVVDHGLTTVCAILNANGEGQAADVSAQQSAEALAAKARAFGWDVVEIDGHDPAAVKQALEDFPRPDKPLAIVARTIKGWGVDGLQNGNWHGKPLPKSELDTAYASLDRAKAGVDTETFAAKPTAPASLTVERRDPREVEWDGLAAAAHEYGLGGAFDKGKLATRRAYGVALAEAGKHVPQLVVLDGDVSNSTFTNIFAKAHSTRFFECKIAEQNMVSTAAGFAAAGFIPFANSFGKFLARAYDQIELAAISRANVKLVGSHSGISLAADGPSQMSVADVAFFRSFATARADDRESPVCWTFQPADAFAAYACTRQMLALRGMCYMRTHRPDVPMIYDAETTFEPRGLHTHGTGTDLAIITAGFMVHVAREAMALLEKQGIRATLVDLYCLPTDAARLREVMARTGRALVVEDNYGGGLAAEVAGIATMGNPFRVSALHVTRIPKSARSEEAILEQCGVGARQIADHARSLLASTV